MEYPASKTAQDQIEAYLHSLPDPKRRDLEALQGLLAGLMPGPLTFLDGKDAAGRVVSNPSIGYGTQTLTYADGTSRPFYRIGLSANTAGLSVYFMGLKDKTWLAGTYGGRLGKAQVTGYCVKFRKLSDIDPAVLAEAVQASLT